MMEIPIRSDMEALKRLANEGNSFAQYDLGRTYYYLSEGILAFHWWAKSARQGNADAMFRLAEFLRTPELRLAAYIKAAERGSRQAQWFLGNMYKFSGELYNVTLEANEERAFFWHQKAAKQDFHPALWSVASFFELDGDFRKSIDYYSKAYYKLSDEHENLKRKYLLATGKSPFEHALDT